MDLHFLSQWTLQWKTDYYTSIGGIWCEAEEEAIIIIIIIEEEDDGIIIIIIIITIKNCKCSQANRVHSRQHRTTGAGKQPRASGECAVCAVNTRIHAVAREAKLAVVQY